MWVERYRHPLDHESVGFLVRRMSVRKSMSDEKGRSLDDGVPKVDIASGTFQVNASGHTQELDRNFSLLSVCAVG